jgi:hypothetical protein
MTLTAVTISDRQETFLDDVQFLCYTTGYEPIDRRKGSSERIEYITRRYNAAVNEALRRFPETTRVLIIDSYYLQQEPVRNFIERYSNSSAIVGASIWCRPMTHIWNNLQYYDVLSVKEWDDKRWHSEKNLPHGLVRVTAVGACWVFPRNLWGGGFRVDSTGESLVNSKSLDTNKVDVFLDCDIRLWRTRETNPDIRIYPWSKRVRVSLGELRRKII